MNIKNYIIKVLSNPIKILNIPDLEIEKENLDKETLKKMIDCWKENIEYDIYFGQLLDYINIQSFSMDIIEYMIDKNVGIEKVSHMQLNDNIMMKLVSINEDANMLLARKFYTNDNYTEEDFIKFFYDNYSDKVYEYLCILNGKSFYKEEIIDYIAKNKSHNQLILKIAQERAKARELRYEVNNDILIRYVDKKNYIYNLQIAENIFASEQILEELKNLKGMKYCKEIKKKAIYTLKKKNMINKE